MPTYEYRCAKCSKHFDVYQSFSEEPLTKHPGCGGKVTKVLSAAGIVLKGSGFYKTDNRSSGKRSATADGNGKDSGSSTNGDSTKATDTKSSESKPSSDSKPSSGGSSSDSKKPAAKSA